MNVILESHHQQIEDKNKNNVGSDAPNILSSIGNVIEGISLMF